MPPVHRHLQVQAWSPERALAWSPAEIEPVREPTLHLLIGVRLIVYTCRIRVKADRSAKPETLSGSSLQT
jgi:hypothetical protein